MCKNVKMRINARKLNYLFYAQLNVIHFYFIKYKYTCFLVCIAFTFICALNYILCHTVFCDLTCSTSEKHVLKCDTYTKYCICMQSFDADVIDFIFNHVVLIIISIIPQSCISTAHHSVNLASLPEISLCCGRKEMVLNKHNCCKENKTETAIVRGLAKFRSIVTTAIL